MESYRIVHFEIPADQPEKLVQFYADLFGWKMQKNPMPNFDYWVCFTGEGPGIDGAIMKRVNPQQTVTNYVSVPQVDDVLGKAKSLGAQVVVPKAVVPGHGWFGVVLDPQGNPLGFWQSDKGAK
jgi:predicted enzyme related to lactoylglutathione lyase